jgi:hypothetical protein
MAKLMGTDAQQEHDDGVRAELNRILAMPDNVADDDIPFSIGRADVARHAELWTERLVWASTVLAGEKAPAYADLAVSGIVVR